VHPRAGATELQQPSATLLVVEAFTPIGDAAGDIDRSRLAFLSALSSGDAEAAAAIYADDATLLAPAADVLQGRPAIERFWRTGVETGIEQVELAVIDLQQRGDIAFEVGRYALHVVPESGARVVDRGRYLVVHRVEADGRWRRAAEMFSPDTAPGLDTEDRRTHE
jgi:uncharacterized protein (TIGR02246 family)